MQSTAATVAAYLKELPDDRRKVMTSLIALCRKHLVGFNEGCLLYTSDAADE